MSGGVKQQSRSGADPRAAPLKLDEFLPYRLNVLTSLVSEALSHIYADRYGIGVPEWRILAILGEFEMMTAKAIGAHSHMHKTKVSRAVSELEKRKLLMRRENRADRREAYLSLTPAGRAIYRELAPGALEFARQLWETVDAADRAAFERAIDRLTEHARSLTVAPAQVVTDDAVASTPAALPQPLPPRASQHKVSEDQGLIHPSDINSIPE